MSSARPEDLQRQLASLDDIAQVVGALRAIASGNAAKALHAVEAIRAYRATVAAALDRALPGGALAGRKGPGMALVIGAAQGFSGAYPARIATAAQQAQAGGAALVVLGQRSLSMFDPAARAAVIHSADLPSHVDQVPVLASQITDALIALGPAHPGPIWLVAGRDLPGQPVETRRIWPPERPPAPAPLNTPLTTLPAADLALALLHEALFAAVALALTEGYRAENQARLEAMARAQTNLRDKRASVQQAFQQARQEQMTTEMIELASGSEAQAQAQAQA